ncbi:hypothetical protein H2200_001642 [Cladophialophora chaetospira]|uniref:Uncharacterized protein n=1 Tax=Cladophialophora chaetospira TaxID=386627 RepID=A0AA38XL94_9EURO|nr:hypothetical protein H2200_001642 [Cladophialophora chaetospira]
MTKRKPRSGRRGNDTRGVNSNSASNQQRQSTSASAASRDGSNPSQNKRAGKGTSNLTKSTDNVQNGSTPTTPSLPPPDDHVSIAGFNAAAVDATLKKGYDAKAPLYKAEAKPQPPVAQSPWGAKPGAMASGKDFWLDLRRQVAALQQTGGVSQGG